MTVRNLILTLLAATAVFLGACGVDDKAPASAPPTGGGSQAASVTQSAPFPVTIKDDHGDTLTLEASPQRIVALAPSFVEVLFAVGAGESVVAVDQNSDFPPEAADLPKISGFEPSVEGIASYDPDLVLMCCFDPGGLEDALRALDIEVLFFTAPATVSGVMDQINTLGRATGHGAEAADLTSSMGRAIEALKAKIPAGAPGPRVYHEVDNTYYTAGPGSFIHDLYATLGAKNIAESTGEAFPQLSAEAIIQADPEVIILADEFAGETPDTVAARPGWDQISAVKNRRVHAVDPNIVSRPGPRLVTALQVLAEILYPGAF